MNELVELYQSGLTITEISTKTGISRSVVHRTLQKLGCKLRKKGPSKAISDPLKPGRKDGKPTLKKKLLGDGDYLWA